MTRRTTYAAIAAAMGKQPVPTDVIAERVGLKTETMRRKLRWMRALGIVRLTDINHGPAGWWVVTE